MKLKNYLPSKKFSYMILFFLIVGFIFFLILNFSSGKSRFFSSKKQEKLASQKMTVNQLIEKDTDGDNVPDWEEALWGTDQNNKTSFENTPDEDYINNKKKILNLKNNPDTENLTETDKFAKEFFTAFTAMKASGQIDASTINNFSNALGQRIIDPSLIDTYKEEDVQISKIDTLATRENHYNTLKNLFEKYKTSGLGEELFIVSNNLAVTSSDNENKPENNLLIISEAYKEFAQEVMKTPTPESLKQYHLKIANSANNTGISVLNMSKISIDPLIGISGLSQYEKYSEDLVNAVAELAKAL